ncbi:MAG TPA: hypothetical protein VNU20_07535 [Candidatus Sulfotelmatobacter sp.]|jgi:hypothetical protein|nr:hypothetical protein [Candidatus Sulfotelmatobacter sp.]
MADWKQITARIRRARTGKDPAAQLANLFTKTRDAMVAFELARYLESIGNSADAGRWYLTAAERFRRSDWKTKAQESATRLGATEPAEIPAPVSKSDDTTVAGEVKQAPEAEPEKEQPEAAGVASEPQTPVERSPAPVGPGSRHRRGRRGHDSNRSPRRADHATGQRESRPLGPTRGYTPPATEEEAPAAAERPSRASLDDSAEVSAPSLRGRYGDPGLASRLTQLEMNFRRLLACAPTKLDDADRAPAGPGVWVLTDSDLTTYYYVEACQTLRVAIPNMARGGTARRGGESIKPKLAEHLGIAESRVSKYLADHCVVRWLQMDEGASYFAHFLIAVLHPSLNE